MNAIAERCSPGFEPLIRTFSEMAERHESTVFGLWPDLRLAYFNPGWVRFGAENGAPPALISPDCLGTSVLDVTAPPLKAYYGDLYRTGLAMTRDILRPLQHSYECSSAGVFRRFSMTLYPLGEAHGLLVVNALTVEEPHDPALRPPHEPDLSAYADRDGLVRQCAHCRRIRWPGSGEDRWDWVPAWVERPPQGTSHTLCTFCLDYFHPGA